MLLDCAGGQTRDDAIGAVRDGGRAYFIVLQGSPPQLERGITGESFAAHAGRQRLEELARLVEAGKLRPQVEGAAAGSGSRGTGAGREPAHSRQDRAGNR